MCPRKHKRSSAPAVVAAAAAAGVATAAVIRSQADGNDKRATLGTSSDGTFLL